MKNFLTDPVVRAARNAIIAGVVFTALATAAMYLAGPFLAGAVCALGGVAVVAVYLETLVC